MKRSVRWVAALYPARWLERYGAEFDALLEDANPRWKDFFDILWGALKMQMASRSIVKTGALAGVLGAIVAAGFAWRMPDRFVSTAVLRPAAAAQAPEVDQMALRQGALSRTALTSVIEKNSLYAPERSRYPMEDVVELMRKDITLRPIRDASGVDAIQVQLAYRDPAAARTAAQDLVANLVAAQENVRRATARLTPGAPLPGSLEVLDPPSLASRPSSPNRPMVIAVGILAGVLLGIIIGFLRRRPVRWMLRVAAFGAAGAVVAAALSFLIPNRFVSSMVLRVPPAGESALRTAIDDSRLLAEINRKFQIYPGDPEAGAIAKMRENLRIVTLKPHGRDWIAVAVQFTGNDRHKAQQVLSDLVPAISTAVPPKHDSAAASALQVLDTPTLPEIPASPNRVSIAMFGLVLGSISGAVRRRRTASA
jgi:hypothetical protein